MAEIILAVLCILIGLALGCFTLIVLWASALEKAATGLSSGGPALWLAAFAVAFLAGGISIFVF